MVPSTDGSTTPSAAPTSSAPPPSGKVVIVSGNVYDEEGATVDGALVTVRSLDASVPYTATATTNQGSWVVNNVPEGANVEIVSTKDGWTTRRRVGSFQVSSTDKKVINFGASGGNAANDSSDTTGESYFISDYPEIASTEPVTDATGVDNQKLTFKLRLSEALDEDSRDTLVDALTILPANAEARGTGFVAPGTLVDVSTPVDFESREDNNASDGVAVDMGSGQSFNLVGTGANAIETYNRFGYTIEEGSTFLGNTNRDVTATWNAEGTELTFSFDATLLADDNDEAKYQAVLVSQGSASDDQIEDEDGNQLGTDAAGSLKNYPAVGTIIANAFKEKDLAAVDAITGYNNRGEANWGSTHDSYVNWEIKRDETDPKLTAVDVSKDVDGDFRFELTFSEGMAAYNGTSTGSYNQAGFEDLAANFRFTIGDKVGDTEDVDLSDNTVTTITTIGATTTLANKLGDVDGEMEKRYTFANALVETAGTGAGEVSDNNDADFDAGNLFIEVDDNNPNTVFIWIKDRPNYFDNKVSEIKAYIDGVKDPAGNTISDNDAEDNQVRGTI